jgi:hypothetical protein
LFLLKKIVDLKKTSKKMLVETLVENKKYSVEEYFEIEKTSETRH